MTNPLDDLAAIQRSKGERVEGTCEWLLVQEEYAAWLVGDNPQQLWLVGAPGIGKTMISSFLVEELEKRAQKAPAMTLAYYFCDNKDEKRNTATAIIRGLLLQLLRQRHILFKYIQRDYDQMKSQLFNSFDALWRILHSMLEDPNAGEVYILIDALDECKKSSREALLKVLAKLFVAPRLDGNLNVKFLIICRPESDIQGYLQDINGHLRIDSGKVNADLSKFIQVKVNDLSKKKKFPPQLKQDVEDALKKKAEGTFLWASLVINDISKTTLASKVRKKLQALPSSLGEVYSRILGNINEEDVDDARFILQWVVGARRPLTVHELAMTRALGPEEWNKNNIPPPDTLGELKDGFRCCEPLLYLDTDNETINLIHQSAKDYLLSEYLEANDGPSRYHIVPDKTHLLIFEICWRYLSMEEFEQGTAIIKRSSYNKLSSKSLSEEFLDAHCFLRYAVQEWQEHALAASPALVAHSVWFNDNLGKMPTLRDTWLHLAAGGGHEAIVKLLLDHKADVDAKDKYRQTALHRAAEGGYEATVKLLLDYKADVDMKGDHNGYCWTALHLAAKEGHKATVKLLLDNKADVNAKGDNFDCRRTALHQAAKGGHEATVKLLLDHNADVNAKDYYDRTALILAAEGGYEATIKLLLDHKADVDAKDKFQQTALRLAAKGGHKTTVKLLLDHKADIDAKDKHHRKTALYLAAEGGYEAVVQLLVENGANVNVQEKQGRKTALHLVAKKGHKAMVQLLVENGANVNAEDTEARTALHLAAMEGHEAVVQLLVENGANVNAQEEEKERFYEITTTWKGKTALYLAAGGGHEAVVQLLIENGANVNAEEVVRVEHSIYSRRIRTTRGKTALHLAAERGHEAMVQLLVENGANVNAEVVRDENNTWSTETRTTRGKTALHLAAERGHEAVVQLLVEKGANVNAQEEDKGEKEGQATTTRKGKTALHLAAKKGHEAVVQLLVKNDANVNAEDEEQQRDWEGVVGELGRVTTITKGKTALHLAAEEGHKAVVQLLVENGANINAEEQEKPLFGNTRKGRRALHLAAEKGHEAVVQLLVENGANVNAQEVVVEDGAIVNAQEEEKEEKEGQATTTRMGKTALHLAAKKGHEATVKLLLDYKADLDAKDYYCEWTALHHAAEGGHEAAVKLLLDHKADVDAKGYYDRTALHEAAQGGHEATVKLLLDYKADVNAKQYYKRTALHLAAGKGHEATVKLLLSYKADANAKDNHKETALHDADKGGHKATVKLLLDHKENIDIKDNDGHE